MAHADAHEKLTQDAVDFAATLDHTSDEREVQAHVENYRRTFTHAVVQRVLEAYMARRGMRMWVYPRYRLQ